jgi:hypothetical protein
MSQSTPSLVERRQRLIAQCDAQRAALAQTVEPWRVPLARVDLGLSALRMLRRNPAVFVGGVVFLTLLRPARAANWLRRGWLGWQLLRGLHKR